MLENGYVKLHRSLMKWEWYDDLVTLKVFLHLMMTVSIKDTKWHGIAVKRGSRVASYSKIAAETKLTIRQTRTAIDHLVTTGELTKSSNTKYTVFSMVNYDKFQAGDKVNDTQTTSKTPAERSQNANQASNNRQQYKKNKEDKEIKKEEYAREKNSSPEPAPEGGSGAVIVGARINQGGDF